MCMHWVGLDSSQAAQRSEGRNTKLHHHEVTAAAATRRRATGISMFLSTLQHNNKSSSPPGQPQCGSGSRISRDCGSTSGWRNPWMEVFLGPSSCVFIAVQQHMELLIYVSHRIIEYDF